MWPFEGVAPTFVITFSRIAAPLVSLTNSLAVPAATLTTTHCRHNAWSRNVNEAARVIAFFRLELPLIDRTVGSSSVVEGGAAPGMARQQAGTQLDRSELAGEQGRPGPDLVCILAQRLPKQPQMADGHFATLPARSTPPHRRHNKKPANQRCRLHHPKAQSFE